MSSKSKASCRGRFCSLTSSCPKKRDGDLGRLWGPEEEVLSRERRGAGTARPGTGVLSKKGPRGGPGLRHSTVAKIKDSREDLWVQIPRPPLASCASRDELASLSFLIRRMGPYLSCSAEFKAVGLGRSSGERSPRQRPAHRRCCVSISYRAGDSYPPAAFPPSYVIGPPSSK